MSPRLGESAQLVVAIAWLAIVGGASVPALAQYADPPGRYFPMNQGMPAGEAAFWSGVWGRARTGDMLPVEIKLPSTGEVGFYVAPNPKPHTLPAPGRVRLAVGHTYRLRLAEMPEYPGVELYPSIEVLDRLNGTPRQVDAFPAPIVISAEDIDTILSGQMVLKVVYVEQPQSVPPLDLDTPLPVHHIPPSVNLLAGADRYGRPLAIVRLGGRVPDPHGESDPTFFGTGAPVVPLAVPADGSKAGNPSAAEEVGAVVLYPTEPRTPAALSGPPLTFEDPNAPGPALAPCECGCVTEECLCDGGDRGLPIHYDRFHRIGLETEDTIAEFTDHHGRRRVQKTNRVCLYAPRFGIVQTTSGPQMGTNIQLAAGAHEFVRGVGLNGRRAPNQDTKRLGPDGVRMRMRASGVESERIATGYDVVRRPAAHELLQNVFQDFVFLKTGQLDRTEEARLAVGIQAALAWTRDANPVVVAVGEGAQEVRATFMAAEIAGVEECKKNGRLRIIKVADREIARPGDVVNFSIRFDNIGDRELRDVRIVDNLTPRLEYIPGSAMCEPECDLITEDNQEGSLVLEFRLREPLPGKTGGFVSFQARVR